MFSLSFITLGDYACSSKPYNLSLSLSSCDESQFTCSGGVCIDMASRCDNINDCDDKSDEADCSRVNIFPTYQKFIVPPPLENKAKTEVTVSLSLSQIMDIRYVKFISIEHEYDIIYFPGELMITTNSSEVGGYFQVQFILTMKWFESRLKFKNLKNDINLNGFLPNENGEIWVPEMIFSNTEEKPSTIVDEKTTIFVEKVGEHKLSASDENENIQYFAGTENPLQLTRFYNQRFLCNYQLKWYPFDIQRCKLILKIKASVSPFTELLVGNYEYTGPKTLTQYEIMEIFMKASEENNIKLVFMEIALGRQLLGVLLNVFIPTIILFLISYSTNFYKDEYFESIIAINLTTMLVIVTLFVSVS